MLKQTLGGRGYPPIGSAGQAAPRIDMAPDFIDERVVAVGFEG